MFLFSRVLSLAAFAYAQHRAHVPVSFSTMLARWDGWWYIYLARHGYPSTLTIPGHPLYGPWGFFPTWPWTIRLVHDVLGVGYPMAAGVAVTAYGLGLVLVLRVYAARLVGARGADAAVLLICVFPGALTFSLAYTEASFLFWTVLALLWLDSRRYLLAGVAVFLACATRSTGVALIAASLVVAVLAIRRRREWAALVPPAAGLLALALMAMFARARTGDAAIWFRAERQWNQTLDFGAGLWGAFTRTIPDGGPGHVFWTVELAMTAVFLLLVLAAVPLRRQLGLPSSVYLIIAFGSIFAYSNVGPRPRMILALFPLLVLAAASLRRWGRVPFGVAVTVLAALSVVVAYVTMYPPLHVTA